MAHLSPAEIDALPFGVIQLDAEGRVELYNRAESLLSGLAPSRVIGRRFFDEIAPCAHLPSFHGRFVDGVRQGSLDSEFEFVFSFDPPVRVQVHMVAAREESRYWLLVRPLDISGLALHRAAAIEAREVVDRRSRAEPVDPDICAQEPIHIPGGVQPHVAMLVADPASGIVAACSANAAAFVGAAPTDIIGRRLGELLPAQQAADLLAYLAAADPAPAPRAWRSKARLGDNQRLFSIAAHRHDTRALVELEMLPAAPDDYRAAAPDQAHEAVSRIRAADTLAEAAAVCAQDMRRLTGFERVLIYAFDKDWNGEAIGECRDDGYGSLLGLRFPASDIPAQARALYTLAPARFVFDRDAVPSPLVARASGDGSGERAEAAPVDLSFAHARALSPIHLQYQRNLGVNGSMSISIIVDGRLWGLVIGHHRRPHYVDPDTRALAGLVTETFALRVHALARTVAWREQQDALSCQNALLRQLAGTDDYAAALTGAAPGDATLIDLFDARGAAVVGDHHIATIGITPTDAEIADLADWLRHDGLADHRTIATTDLSRQWPPAAAWRRSASGLLAVTADADRRYLLLWFRPEVAATIAWGGDPNKPVLADVETRTLLPRRSFERWVEERHHEAEPWAPWHAEAAEAFAAALEGVVLRHGRRIAEMEAKQHALTVALAQKDVLSREIDHRVKNSLQFVASVLLLQGRRVADPDARTAFENAYGRVMSIARVHDSLRQSDTAAEVDFGDTVRQLCDDLAGSIVGSGRRIVVDAPSGLVIPSRAAVSLAMIATELIANALQHAYPPNMGGDVAVTVHAREPAGLSLMVCDDGRGLPPDWDQQRAGGGLGMRVIGAMISQLDAKLVADGDRQRGTCFTVLM